MGKFGEYLVENGAIQPEQLEEACRSQVVYGGRLGTNLVELGYIVLEELATHLSAFHGVALAPIGMLEHPDPKAIQVIPQTLVRRFKALPMKLERDRIHIALPDPKDRDALDFLGAAAGRPLVPYVLPEVRLLYWLECHLGIDRHPRYVNLAARVRQTGLGQNVGDGSSDPNVFQVLPEGASLEDSGSFRVAPEAPSVRPESLDLEPADELLLDDIVATEAVAQAPRSTGSPNAPIAPPSTPAQVVALEAQLEGATERDAVVDLGLRLALAYARTAAVFLVRDDTVVGFRGQGEGLSPRLDGIALPVDTPSIFARPATDVVPFRGEPPRDGIDGRLLEALGRADAQELLIAPIAIRGRAVNLLYVDNGPDPLGDTSVAALRELCCCMARAYERLILEQKRARRR